MVRYIGLHKDRKLRKIQINYLVKLISKCNNNKEIRTFIENVISPSELAYISQRLHIIKLISEEKTYLEIKDNTGTTSSTINATKILMKSIDDKVLSLISNNNLNEKKKEKIKLFKSSKVSFVKANYPGAIKLE